MKRWFVVHTRPNAEPRAFGNLVRQGYEAFFPSYRMRRAHARKVDFVARPLFPRYLFVALDLLEARWRPILGTFGVSDLVRRGDSPIPVPAGVVEALRAGVQAAAFDEVEPAARLCAGDAVRILAGPFAEMIGRFQALADSDRVVVLLDLLGREVRATLPTRAIVAA